MHPTASPMRSTQSLARPSAEPEPEPERVERTIALDVDEILDDRIRKDPESGMGSIYDVIMLLTGMQPAHVSQAWKRLIAAYPEVNTKCVNFQFAGPGQRPTPVAPLPVLVEIAWLCPGRAAKEFRRKGAETICRALAGDLSLVDEIERRHSQVAGTETQAQLLQGTGVSLSDANGTALALKRKREDEWEDVELKRARAEVARMERENLRLEQENRSNEVAFLREALTILETLPADEADERDLIARGDTRRLLLRQLQGVISTAPGSMIPLLTLHDDDRGEEISVALMEQRTGLRLSRKQRMQAGKLMAQFMREKYGADVHFVKRREWVDGRAIEVNCYYERDAALLERAVREAAAGRR